MEFETRKNFVSAIFFEEFLAKWCGVSDLETRSDNYIQTCLRLSFPPLYIETDDAQVQRDFAGSANLTKLEEATAH